MICASRYVAEHKLYDWVAEQNVVHGVAPSRSQLVEQALASVPPAAPRNVQEAVRFALAGQARSQRK